MINILKEKALEGGDLASINPVVRMLAETDEVRQLLAEDQAYCDERVRFFQMHNELAAQALWTRAHEKSASWRYSTLSARTFMIPELLAQLLCGRERS